jgi:PAS domain S-box-containing protein
MLAKLFHPAVFVMNRLKYPQKLALISLCFVLPLALVLTLYVQELETQIRFTRQEQLGASYLHPLHSLLDHALQAKLAAYEHASGQSAARLAFLKARTQVEADFDALQQLDQQAPLQIRTQLGMLQARWEQLADQTLNLPPEASEERYSRLIVSIRDLMGQVGERSALVFDPQAESGVLAEVLVRELPEGQALIGQNLLYGQRLLAGQEAVVGTRLQTYHELLRSHLAQTGRRLEFALQQGAGDGHDSLQAAVQHYLQAADALIDSTERGLSTGEPPGSGPEQYQALGAAAQQANTALWEQGSSELERLLQARIAQLQWRQGLVLGASMLALLLALALWGALYQGTMHTLSQLAEAARRMAQGERGATTAVEARDELGQVVLSFNELAGALASALSYRYAVVDNAVEGIITADERGVIQSLNPAAEAIFGYPVNQLVGQPFLRLIPEEAVKEISDLFERVSAGLEAGPKRLMVETLGRRKDGESFPLELALSEMWLGEQRLVIAMLRDITERQQAAEALRESEERHRLMLDFSPDPIVLYDLAGHANYVNNAFVQTFGWAREELLGKRIDFVPAANMEETRGVIARVFRDDKVLGFETRRFTKDQRILDIQLSAALFRDKSGAPASTMVVLRDISTLKRTEAALQQAKDAAEAASRAKSAFLANMSHELRTPLNSIINFTGFVIDGLFGPLSEDQHKYLLLSLRSSEHLLRLINDILDLSKIEAGKMELFREQVELPHLFEGVLGTITGLAQAKGLELVQEMPEQLPPVWADQTRIRQILLNLLSNAVKFTDEGQIILRTTVKPNEVIISVTDTGIGIPIEKQYSVFEEFEQVDNSTTRNAEGTGLGLAITKRLVEMHGGRMWLESKVGVGSTFFFSLPLTVAPPPVVQAPSQPAATDSNGPVVLVIDDDMATYEIIRHYLGPRGYQVVAHDSGMGAHQLIKEILPSLIILDILMPHKDGWQVLNELKADPETATIPVLVCTALHDQGLAFHLGADDYVTKPVRRDVLLNAVGRITSSSAVAVIIDDDPNSVEVVAQHLAQANGCRVVRTYGGEEGWAAVTREQPDLVILDLMMPGVDGLEVLQRIRTTQATHDLPVIVVTAKELTADERRLLHARVQGLLQKGRYSADEFASHVLRVLGSV